MRNLVYSFDRSFEGALSAMSAFLVGWTAEHWFGFVGDATAHCDADQTADSRTLHDVAKAKSLGNAMLLFSVVPWALALLHLPTRPGQGPATTGQGSQPI
eukprot:gene23219-30440_t